MKTIWELEDKEDYLSEALNKYPDSETISCKLDITRIILNKMNEDESSTVELYLDNLLSSLETQRDNNNGKGKVDAMIDICKWVKR
jgi:hypothetical protein